MVLWLHLFVVVLPVCGLPRPPALATAYMCAFINNWCWFEKLTTEVELLLALRKMKSAIDRSLFGLWQFQ